MLRRLALTLVLAGAAIGCGREPASPATPADPTVGSVHAAGGTSWGEIVYRLDSLVMSKVPRFELVVDGEPARRTKPIEIPHDGRAHSVIFAVDISDVGSIVAVNSKPATAETYRAELASWLRSANAGSREVVIRADTRAPFASVVDVARTAQDFGGVVLFAVGKSFASKPRAKDLDWGKCAPFPRAADAAKIDSWALVVGVHVDSEGNATRVDIVEGDEFGFGDVARSCALRASYEPARATDGRAIEGDVTFRVRFER